MTYCTIQNVTLKCPRCKKKFVGNLQTKAFWGRLFEVYKQNDEVKPRNKLEEDGFPTSTIKGIVYCPDCPKELPLVEAKLEFMNYKIGKVLNIRESDPF